MKRSFASAAALALLIGPVAAPAKKPVRAPTLEAVLNDPAGKTYGSVQGRETGTDVELIVAVKGLVPGAHGIHIHAVGACEGPAFASAGAHWNPDMKMHGHDNPMGAHRGDLPNLLVNDKGVGRARIRIAGGIADLLDADGASIIIHATADDYKSDPSGNSGARLICGVIERR